MHQARANHQQNAMTGSAEQRNAIIGAFDAYLAELHRDACIYLRSRGFREDIPGLADDALQETVIRALRLAERYVIDASARAWLRSILANVVKEMGRRRMTERRLVVPAVEAAAGVARERQERGLVRDAMGEDELLGLIGAITVGPEARPEASFNELLALVGDADRKVLQLAFAERLRGKALADELGISTAAAYTRLSRAIDRIQDAYHRAGLGG